MSGPSDGGENGLFEGLTKGRPGFAPGDGYAPGDQPFREFDSRSESGVDTESYQPSSYGRQAARDGYSRDAYSDAYEERGYGYGDRASRGQGYARGYEQPAIGYGGSYDRRNKSYDDLNDRDYSERREIQKYQRDDKYRNDKHGDRGRDRSRGARSRKDRSGSRSGSEDGEGKGKNPEVAKWGATLAGALIGAASGRKVKKDNWIGPAIGAVVGGLVAREAEKEVYKYREHRREEKGYEDSSYRSKSR